MLKVLINEEEVVSNQNFTINKQMLNTPSVILKNVCPKTWRDNNDYTTNFYHPQDYSKCKILDVTDTPAEPGSTIEGTAFTIPNNDNNKLHELTTLKGNTTQASTPTPDNPVPVNVVSGGQEVNVVGKNLFDISNSTPTKANFTFENDILTVQATGGNYNYIQLNPNDVERTIKENAGKTLKFRLDSLDLSQFDSTNDVIIQLAYSINGTNSYNRILERKTSSPTGYKITDFVIPNDTSGMSNFRFNILANNSATASSTSKVVITKPMFYFGEDSTYEEYKEQSYEINLGKNYINYDAVGIGQDIQYGFNGSELSLNGTTSSSGQIAITSTQPITLPMGTYTFSSTTSGTFTANGKSTAIYLRKLSDNTGIITLAQNNSYTLTSTFTLTETTKVYVQIYTNGAGFVFDNFKIKWQIEKGSTKTNWVQYKTPIELCKINDYQDFIRKGTGKNLFDYTASTFSDAWRVNITTENNVITMTTTATTTSNNLFFRTKIPDETLVNGKTYILSSKNISGVAQSLKLQLRNKDGSTASKPQVDSVVYDDTYSLYIVGNIFATSGSTSIPSGTIAKISDVQVEEGNQATLFEPYGYKDKWYLYKTIGKVVLNGSESWQQNSGATLTNTNYFSTTAIDNTCLKSYNNGFANYFTRYARLWSTDVEGIQFSMESTRNIRIRINKTTATDTATLKTWLSTHNTIVYYILATPTTTEITDSELISQLEGIELLQGINNVSVSSGDLPGIITIHYNYVNASHTEDLLFCGVVKNSGNISLNPREPHYSTLQILDFKTFLSEGELDSFVIYQKTITEAIQMVIANIQDYGFVLGNIKILTPDDIIGAYSTKDKSAFDVFNYIADITQSRWTTRMIDENHVAIDFYDPTLMDEGTEIDYTQAFFENNLIDTMTYSYGSNNYRNKQVMTSSQVYSNISQTQSIVANGYQTQFPTEQPIGKVNSITSNGIPLTYATFQEREMGYVADFYYQPGENYFESDDLRSTGEILIIDYIAIVEGRQIITNPTEINRINESTNRKGIVSRYEQRNDATTSMELQKIGETYIKYKGTPEIKLKITTRKNIWEVGERVQFNAPITELDTEYMVRTKKINYIASVDTIFYDFELISSFNSETEINYFDNQRAKTNGNIGEGEYISRNIDIESTANIIFYDTASTEVQVDGDNVLNSILNSPFIS